MQWLQNGWFGNLGVHVRHPVGLVHNQERDNVSALGNNQASVMEMVCSHNYAIYELAVSMVTVTFAYFYTFTNSCKIPK